uniref:mating-type protein A-alpha Z4 n=1 Tax=Erigeron canadensis TaxID=72917 RepID=UPI001CB91198|nr:mating-type protein A-alpha Z4 [Erigeron canadensis]
MNAVSNSEINNFTTQQDNADGSDTDTISDDYYEPISIQEDEDDDGQDSSDRNSDHDLVSDYPHQLSNGCVQNGINSLDLNSDNDDEEEEEERMREEEVRRAFREDENRRRAPLTQENANRVREAMRGISFSGLVPDWAGRVPEDRWVDQIASIRSSTS